jgi:hypothetical protein
MIVVGQIGNLRRIVNTETRPGAGWQPARRMPSCPTFTAETW